MDYEKITNHNYPGKIYEKENLNITFIDDIPTDIMVLNATFNYDSPNLSISNPSGNVTVKGEVDYFYEKGPVTFNNSYIDTHMYLFSEENKNRNFEVKFTIDSLDATQEKQAVIFNDMSEAGTPYPGLVFRTLGTTSQTLQIVANSNSQESGKTTNYVPGMQVVIKRVNNILYYSVNGGETYAGNMDFSTFTTYFDNTLIFGAGHDANLNMQRFLKGTLSNIHVKVY